ncbi:putative methylesterase 11, chloroplastic isoform X1 [Physcomitrium patens]|uniref:AB hydrolase-1 domain-containing protein n=1 Tax=Physcomitrium patens TaxID=3218 RepID=A9RY72_PHYPA|nr:putative methylesterase 11, chloroplastic isoform X1 [Physcomitrium patens]PNR49200.1 hypothetical protein PHYPA_011096 [Physcomitrium patens]|eukprot:XP_024383343.1 putative methylesterase 11, chloroplastic isoform X1 [Physcomitrella patens]
MGNQMACFGGGEPKKKKKVVTGGLRKRGDWENGAIEQQALALALQQQHRAQMRFERSMSNRDQGGGFVPPRKSYSGKSAGGGTKDEFKRSASTRARHIDDLLLDPRQLVNGSKDGVAKASIETKHFVLVHGGGFGAWCWYKSIALLEESGLVATVVDLKGSGIESMDPNEIKSMAVYAKPLLVFLEKLGADEKVILVAHNIGGACISYAMECFPTKVSKAIFVAAAMITDGQRAFDVFVRQENSEDDLMPKAQKFLYGNGTSSAPTAVELDRSLIKDLFFNCSPAKDIALAMVSMRPIPFSPAMEKIALTAEKYGSVRRFYIETTEDQALTPELQRNIINQNPPEQVFTLKGSDHSPFFSKPQSLHKILVDIAMIGPK